MLVNDELPETVSTMRLSGLEFSDAMEEITQLRYKYKHIYTERGQELCNTQEEVEMFSEIEQMTDFDCLIQLLLLSNSVMFS